MNWQRDRAIIISGVVSLVLAGLAIFLIIQAGGKLKQGRQDLEAADSQIRRMTSSEVYPNGENLKVLAANSSSLTTFKEEQLARLREKQVEVLPMTPTDFIDDVKSRFNALRASSLAVRQAAAERDKVGDEALKVDSAIADTFFGDFGRYGDEGFPPSGDHIPRLSLQLQDIDNLCKILVKNEVTEVVSVTRTKFDEATKAPAKDDSESVALPLYESEYYDLTLLAREDVTWRILQDISNADSLYAITRGSFRNENMGMQTDMTITVGASGGASSGGGLAALLGRSKKKDKKVEGATTPGKELVRTQLKVKVTRFPQPPAPEGEGDDTSEEPASEEGGES